VADGRDIDGRGMYCRVTWTCRATWSVDGIPCAWARRIGAIQFRWTTCQSCLVRGTGVLTPRLDHPDNAKVAWVWFAFFGIPDDLEEVRHCE
jgi:hypothetical protein